MNELYVYALVDRSARAFRLAGRKVEFVRVGGVYAAVERIGARPALSEASLTTQHAIVSRIGKSSAAILPARFGSVVDAGELARIVDLRRADIEQALALVRGRSQMTIRIGLLEIPPRVVLAIGPPASGTAYLRGRKQAAAPAVPDAIVDALNGAPSRLVKASRSGPVIGSAAMALYHLIDRGHEPEYRRAVAASARTLNAVDVRVSGPWPPFAFAPELGT